MRRSRAASSTWPGWLGVNSSDVAARRGGATALGPQQEVDGFVQVELEGQARCPGGEVERRRAGLRGPEAGDHAPQHQLRLGHGEGVVDHQPRGHQHHPAAGELVQRADPEHHDRPAQDRRHPAAAH